MANARVRIAFVGLVAALGMSLSFAHEMKLHYNCRVTGTSHLDQVRHDGHSPEMTHFTCRISGGLLEGFVATGTNIMEGREEGRKLVGSMVIAQKADSTLVYEVSDGTRRVKKDKGGRAGWESTGTGIYKLATGIAMPLAGKSFRSLVRSESADTFTIDVVVRLDHPAQNLIQRR